MSADQWVNALLAGDPQAVRASDRLLRDMETVSELTAREHLVLGCCSHGMGTAEIAECSDWTVETVKDIRKRVCHKLMARNMTHAVAIAIRDGIIT